MSGKDELESLRDEIGKVTVEIIRLCGKRSTLARKIGEIKAERGLQIEDLKVEENTRHEILKKCQLSGVNEEFGLKLLGLLLDESKRVQRNLIKKGKSDK